MDITAIKELVTELLAKMSVTHDEVSVRAPRDDRGSHAVMINTKESGRLIGVDGAHFEALNHVVKKMVAKQSGTKETPRFMVDVNEYSENMLDKLRLKARLMADRAVSFKTSVEFDPMSSYERMVVHSELQTLPNIKTESVGEGRDRRVVVKYTAENVQKGS